LKKAWILTFILISSNAPFLWAEHSRPTMQSLARPEIQTPSKRLGFKATNRRELLPNQLNPDLVIQIEEGTFQQEDGPKKAIRVYRGTPNENSDDLDLIATSAGKARTVIAAKKACEKLAPLGKWRLASFTEMMAFFGDPLSSYPVPGNPNKVGYLFWASSPNLPEDAKNRDVFFTAPGNTGNDFDRFSYKIFISQIRSVSSKAKNPEEKQYWRNFLKFINDGIPVTCVFQ